MLYNENDEYAMLSSVDFITPVVDDPYIYGQIAAANALSDIFAMGGVAKSALNLLMWDSTHFDVKVANAILKGGLDKIAESGALLLGGHTIKDMEQKYGLSVNGIVHKDRIWRNNTAQEGDVLVLTKPLGSGILTTAIKARMLSNQDEVVQSMAMLNLYAMQVAQNYEIHACTDITGFGLIGHAIKARMLSNQDEVVQSMAMLNLYAMQVAQNYEIHACTDITGFGLIGHALEMCRANKAKKPHSYLRDFTEDSPYDKSILFYTTQIPLFENTRELSQMGIVPGGSYENKNALCFQVQIDSPYDKSILFYTTQIPLFENTRELSQMGIVPGGSYENKNALCFQVQIQTQIQDDIFYYDAQTSGGLLFALPFSQAKSFVYDLRKAGITCANIIGEVVPKREKTIILG